MNRVRRRANLRPPEGWEDVKNGIILLNDKMKELERKEVQNSDSNEVIWKIMRTNWERSRLVFNLYKEDKKITKELFNWILKNDYADENLIRQWNKQGYERLCCVACINRNTNHGNTCICRIPKKQRNSVKCCNCGCSGCCSGDFDSVDSDNKECKDQDKCKNKDSEENTPLPDS